MPEITEEQLKDLSPEQIAELQKQNCPFCMIASGKIPAIKVYEDSLIIGVMDIRPASKGHVLVFPREHRPIMPLMSKEEINALAIATKKISNAVLIGMKVKGTTIFIANGYAAGQKAPHFLLHVIPRNDNDNLFNLKPERISEEDLKRIQDALK